MARVCREIQERIEETREEAREECRNVSRTITETICSWMPWPFSELCNLVSRVITEVVCNTIWVIITIVSWVTRVVCETIFIIDWIITHLIGIIEWLVNRIITFPEWVICQIGVNTGRKNFRICPIVIADAAGNPVVPLPDIQDQINEAVRIYNQCNINVIASPITVVTDRPHLANAPGCDAGGYFGEDRIELEHLSCCQGFTRVRTCLRFPSGLLWPRHVLKAIWVDNLSSGHLGCYMLPESYILMTANARLDTLAHEMGHAGDLLHEDDDNNNLMFTPGRSGSNLTNSQCCTLRTSRFVTIL
ncbi:hypothetical protein JKA74_13590 [Marivirga sp. S37H4]|uniref:Uncharacterized protein n=1 Tax=Marivirga aurantiaca TaxID=2802615 RepID=A0A934X0E6_9BACT|nr:hypothetical protein [Marivirga aurantiaca]MBK6266071.1 hypothetical protein [Marivirga aurantiaca]